jgi:hypothetical protein
MSAGGTRKVREEARKGRDTISGIINGGNKGYAHNISMVLLIISTYIGDCTR